VGRFIAAALFITSSTALAAQSPAVAVTLEAAAIKPAPPGSTALAPGNWAPPTSSGARLRPQTLRTLVMYAFDVNPSRRHDPPPVGGPSWIDQNLYQLTLKFSATPTVVESRDLIRRLLEDRFKLKWHREQRETQVYVLTLARQDGRIGPGLKASRLDCRSYSETLTRTGRGAVAKAQAPDCGVASGGAPAVVAMNKLAPTMTYPTGAQLAHGTGTMVELLRVLQNDRENDRPILDRTGLTGTYDVDLWWVPERSGAIGADPADVRPLAVAVQQQLGLKFESRREPYEVIVIDAAELPELD
jgi:uncharacterized protein (TIGR03435 family)